MKNINKQSTGFKFGKYHLLVLQSFGEFSFNSRVYRLLLVQTHSLDKYYSLRLYNQNNHFIKQFLFEPQSLHLLISLLESACHKTHP